MLESASSLFLLEETVFGLVFANDADVRLHAVKVRSEKREKRKEKREERREEREERRRSLAKLVLGSGLGLDLTLTPNPQPLTLAPNPQPPHAVKVLLKAAQQPRLACFMCERTPLHGLFACLGANCSYP